MSNDIRKTDPCDCGCAKCGGTTKAVPDEVDSHLEAVVEFKDFSPPVAGDPGTFRAYFAAFDNVDRVNDILEKGSVRNIDTFVKDGFVAVNHEWGRLSVATVDSAEQDDHGLLVAGTFHSTPEAQAVRTVVRERLERGKSVKGSIGYSVAEADPPRATKERPRRLKSIDVHEVSFVAVPANPRADVLEAKAMGHPEAKRGARVSRATRERLAEIADHINKGHKLMGRGRKSLASFLSEYDPDRDADPTAPVDPYTLAPGKAATAGLDERTRTLVAEAKDLVSEYRKRYAIREAAGRKPSRSDSEGVAEVLAAFGELHTASAPSPDATSSHTPEVKAPESLSASAPPGGKAASAEAAHEDTETKGVVPFKSGPVKEGAWDGTAADNRVRAWAGGPGKDAIDWGEYRTAFAYVDPGDGGGAPADFGSYHLLHHDAEGDALKVSRRGVFAAAVIIQGGRGGGKEFVARIGPQATAGVRAHLGKHYSEDLDMPAPWDREKAGLYPEEVEATGVTEAELKALGWAALPAPGEAESGPGSEAKSAPAPAPVSHSEVMQLFTRYIETIEAPRLGIASPAGR